MPIWFWALATCFLIIVVIFGEVAMLCMRCHVEDDDKESLCASIGCAVMTTVVGVLCILAIMGIGHQVVKAKAMDKIEINCGIDI
jgi:threonine/homoserine/homoserine lactone efflux protein